MSSLPVGEFKFKVTDPLAMRIALLNHGFKVVGAEFQNDSYVVLPNGETFRVRYIHPQDHNPIWLMLFKKMPKPYWTIDHQAEIVRPGNDVVGHFTEMGCTYAGMIIKNREIYGSAVSRRRLTAIVHLDELVNPVETYYLEVCGEQPEVEETLEILGLDPSQAIYKPYLEIVEEILQERRVAKASESAIEVEDV